MMEGALCILDSKREVLAGSRGVMRRFVTLLLILLTGYLIILRHHFIFSHPYPISTDGFYYLTEYRSWIEQGTAYYDRFSPGTILVGLLGSLLNLTPEVLYNVALLASLWSSSLCLYLLARSRAPLFASVLFAAFWGSDLLFYRHYAFLNQSLGVAAAFFAVLADEKLKGACRGIGVSLLALLAALLHPFGGAICAVVLMRNALSNRVAILLLTVVLAAAIFGVLQVEREIFQFPTLNVGWSQACTSVHCSSQEYGEFILITALVLFILYRSPISKATSPLLLFLLLQLPIWSPEEQVAQRLAFSSVWAAFLSLSVTTFQRKAVTTGGVALLLITLLPSKSYTDPYPSTSLLPRHKQRLQQWIPENATVVAPHGMQFRVTYLLERKSRREMGGDEETPLFLYGHVVRRRRCVDINSISTIEPQTSCVLLSGTEGIERIR